MQIDASIANAASETPETLTQTHRKQALVTHTPCRFAWELIRDDPRIIEIHSPVECSGWAKPGDGNGHRPWNTNKPSMIAQRNTVQAVCQIVRFPVGLLDGGLTCR